MPASFKRMRKALARLKGSPGGADADIERQMGKVADGWPGIGRARIRNGGTALVHRAAWRRRPRTEEALYVPA